MEQRDEMALSAVKLYYEQGLSQQEVAKELGISRPTVSKMIQYGKDRGFVTVQINDPRERSSAIADQLAERFNLAQVRIAHPTSSSSAEVLHELGLTGASLVESLIDDHMSVGVSWGSTLNAVAHALRVKRVSDVKIVQLKGGHSHSERTTNDMDTLSRFCHAFNGSPEYLPLPVIFDSPEAKEIVERDRHIANVLKMGATTDMCVFTAGDISRENLLLNLGYLSDQEVEELLEKAVGDVCSRFFTEDGDIALPSVDNRTVGITLEQLRTRPIRVLIAGETTKAQAIATALKMGLVTHLVTDDATGQKVLALTQED